MLGEGSGCMTSWWVVGGWMHAYGVLCVSGWLGVLGMETCEVEVVVGENYYCCLLCDYGCQRY